MADFQQDQAAGLRRLFEQQALKVAGFASGTPGVGKTSVVVNVAVALARQGNAVLVVDENSASHASLPVGAFFGRDPGDSGGDLLQVLDGERGLDDVVQGVFPGVNLLPAGQAARHFGRLSAARQQALQAAMGALKCPVDVILVDTSARHAQGFSPWGLAAGESVMIVSGSGTSIMDSYALIKKVSLSFARRHFRILVNRVKTPEDGETIFANLKTVAAERGIAHLEYGGAIPLDPHVKHMGRFGQPLTVSRPESPAAQALGHFAANLATWPRADCAQGLRQFAHTLLDCCHKENTLRYG